MRAAIAALTLALATPASSHCFTQWYYPTPQAGCAKGHTGGHWRHFAALGHFPTPTPVKAVPEPTVAQDEAKDWYVEITKLPPEDEAERKAAIEELKHKLAGDKTPLRVAQ